MPSIINPVAVPLTSLISPGVGGPSLGPVVLPRPTPRPAPQFATENAPTYARYRFLLEQLAQTPGVFGSAEWQANFARHTAFDARVYELYKKCGNLGETTSSGSAPPQDTSRYVVLTNYLPGLALKSVTWVAGSTATVLWIGSNTIPPVTPPGGGPQKFPRPVTGPLIVPVTSLTTPGPVRL